MNYQLNLLFLLNAGYSKERVKPVFQILTFFLFVSLCLVPTHSSLFNHHKQDHPKTLLFAYRIQHDVLHNFICSFLIFFPSSHQIQIIPYGMELFLSTSYDIVTIDVETE